MASHGLRWTEEQLAKLLAKRAPPLQIQRIPTVRRQKMQAIAARNAAAESYRIQQSDGRIELDLPWPPTINDRYRSNGVLTETARAFRRHVVALCRCSRVRPLLGRLEVQLVLHPPGAGNFDLDNRVKATLDALQHARCFPNDNAVDRLVVERGRVRPGGLCCAVVQERRR